MGEKQTFSTQTATPRTPPPPKKTKQTKKRVNDKPNTS